jgi:hypothetical protein
MMPEAGRRNSWPCSVIYQSLEKLDIAVDVPSKFVSIFTKQVTCHISY